MKFIIPCAGYGTRMNMSSKDSKEMLHIPGEIFPIIQQSIDLSHHFKADPIIISREEKKNFNNYLKKQKIEPVLIESKGEWMDSVLESDYYWDDTNILIFPDTRWLPKYETIEKMLEQLKEVNLSIALHKVSDNTKWCVLDNNRMIEKPTASKSVEAMGLVGWKGVTGHSFFTQLSVNKRAMLPDTKFVDMDSFIDYTRGDYKLT